MAMVSDTVDVATAVKRRGGVVVVAVGRVADPAHAGRLILPAALVSFLVVDPELEQVIGATHASPWPFRWFKVGPTLSEDSAPRRPLASLEAPAAPQQPEAARRKLRCPRGLSEPAEEGAENESWPL